MSLGLRHLGLAVLGLSLGIALLEIGLRAAAHYDPAMRRRTQVLEEQPEIHWRAHPFLPYVAIPNSQRVEYQDGHRVELTFNEVGLRSHPLPSTKSPEDFFVIALGESTTWGQIAPTNAETWPELLEAKLQASAPHRRVRVFNFGLSGATSAVSVASLVTLGVHLRPDLVLAYHGFNEWGAAPARDFRTDQAHFYRDFVPEAVWLGFRGDLPQWARTSHALVRIASFTDTILGVESFLDATTRPRTGFMSDPEVVVGRLVANLVTIDTIARGHGARALFSTFQFFTPDVPPYPVNDMLRRLLPAAGLEFVDIDAAIPDGRRDLQIDDCHFTDEGRQMVADAFYEAIVAHGWLP